VAQYEQHKRNGEFLFAACAAIALPLNRREQASSLGEWDPSGGMKCHCGFTAVFALAHFE
jgi:hypothetical protein